MQTKLHVRYVALLTVAMCTASSVNAETWVLNANQKDLYGDADGQYNMEYWKSLDANTNGLTSSALVYGDDYIVEKGYQLSLKEGYRFVGKSLTIGQTGSTKTGLLRLRGSNIEFPNEGVFLCNGIMSNLKYRSTTR